MNIEKLNHSITQCHKCPRIVSYLKEVDSVKVKRFRDETYWSKPVPGFGDHDAELVIVGLAPGAHGANRTGRMFTGDKSGDWLFRALYETAFANQPTSEHKKDGLELTDAFIVSTAHCAPPKNKLTAEEITNCSSYLKSYLDLLHKKKVIVCLGGVAFKNFTKLFNHKGLEFGHLNEYTLKEYTLISSYHPSQYNTSTGRLKWQAWLQVFERAKVILESS